MELALGVAGPRPGGIAPAASALDVDVMQRMLPDLMRHRRRLQQQLMSKSGTRSNEAPPLTADLYGGYCRMFKYWWQKRRQSQTTSARSPGMNAHAQLFRSLLPEFSKDNGMVPNVVPGVRMCRGLCVGKTKPADFSYFTACSKDLDKLCRPHLSLFCLSMYVQNAR